MKRYYYELMDEDPQHIGHNYSRIGLKYFQFFW